MNGKRILKSFRDELAKVRKWKAAAVKRVKDQKAAGDQRGAELSQSAVDYCTGYEARLEHIVEGYEKRAKGGHYFTKDTSRRFIEK